jgi:hypothetical protein
MKTLILLSLFWAISAQGFVPTVWIDPSRCEVVLKLPLPSKQALYCRGPLWIVPQGSDVRGEAYEVPVQDWIRAGSMDDIRVPLHPLMIVQLFKIQAYCGDASWVKNTVDCAPVDLNQGQASP